MISPDFEQNPPLVLIVDDEKTVRLVLRRAMQKEGYRIAEAADGEQCLDLCLQIKPDLVLLDAMMPQIDGFTCCAQLLALLGNESPAVLMITTLNDKASVDQAFDVGAADYITKPIDWPVLCQRVRRLLQTRWAMTQLLQRTEDLTTANAALHAEITERQQAEERIKASLKEKEVLLTEIHHRVKNNLQIISSLLKLQSRSVKDIQTLTIFNESQSRIRTMALIHESLDQSNDFSRISIADYIRKLVANLFRSYEISSSAIKSIINVENVFLKIDVAVPCGLIINELVSNSLKYAFSTNKEGEIQVELYSEDNRGFVLVVADNGVGLSQDFSLQEPKTFGLELVKNLAVNQLKGNIKISGNSGTKFRITFSS